MRVCLADHDRIYLFARLVEKGYPFAAVADQLGVSTRTLTDWKRGKYRIPKDKYQQLLVFADLQTEQFNPVFVDEKDQKALAGRRGGLSYFKKYGSLGSTQSRKRGGVVSFQKRRFNPNDIFARKSIDLPDTNEKLAEFIGIMIGDGSIADYQVSVSLNMTDDIRYADSVAQLISSLFGVQPTYQYREKQNCVVLVVSSVELVELLITLGLPKGDKIKQGLDIPQWISGDIELLNACIRGIFDTDGCIFSEKHRIGTKTYSYPRMSFVSASEKLRSSLFLALTDLGLEARIRQSRSVNLERFTDIEEYFRIIGSSNPKHLDRAAAIGGVG